MSQNYETGLALYIDGERLGAAGRSTHSVINPATGAPQAQLPLATAADLDRALDTAARGFALWRARTPDERGAVLARAASLLRERAERIATVATLEEGKTLGEAMLETRMAVNLFEFY